MAASTPLPNPNAGRRDISGNLLTPPAGTGGTPTVFLDSTPTVNGVTGPTTISKFNGTSSPAAAPAPAASTFSAPATAPATAPGGTATPPAVPNSYGPNGAFSTAEENLAPGADPNENDFFDKVYAQIAPVIDSINSTETAAEKAAYASGSKEQTDLNASLGSRGLGGSSEAARLGFSVNQDTAGAVAAARSAQTDAISKAYQFITGQAYTAFKDARTRNDTLSADYVQNMQATALATVKGIAESGITSAADLQSKNPQAYASLLQYYNNDPVALNSALVMNQPANKVVQSWVQGSTYYQLVTDPVTGQPKVQSLDTGVNIPSTWTPNKVGTTTLLMQDPNNPANSVTYTTNPFTGEVTASGSGTGSAIADEYNKAHPTAGSGNGSTSTGTGSGATAISQTLGVDPSTSLADVVASSGIGAVVAAIINNEGGSPAGVANNPGNVKFTGAAGQTDSGVKASDGGTFASYATPDQGQQAIADLVTSAASGQSSAYGANPTLGSFAGTYTNTGSTTTSSGTGLPTGEYGLAANVDGFNPTVPGIDADAWQYLNTYLTQGKVPVATDVGLSSRSGSIAAFTTVKNRADDVYFKATGQHLPDIDILDSNKKLIAGNNSLLNSLSLQEKTIKANSDLMQGKINAENINQNAPAINSVVDYFKNYFLGNPDVASYLAQNSTLSNELGSLLALKNASGTTVHDKLISADLISPNASASQEAEVVNTLMQEAMNARSAIGSASASLYQQIDPLGIQPGNPIGQPGYQEFTGAGFTNNYDGTWTIPTSMTLPDGTVLDAGTVVKSDANGNVETVQ